MLAKHIARSPPCAANNDSPRIRAGLKVFARVGIDIKIECDAHQMFQTVADSKGRGQPLPHGERAATSPMTECILTK